MLLKSAVIGLVTVLAVQVPVATGPSASQNPFTAPAGGASTHGDSASAKTFAGPGPAGGAVKVTRSTLPAACPTLLHGSDKALLALCTEYLGQAPVLKLIDRADGNALASLTITKGSLLGGVYAYPDQRNRVVIVDRNRDLLRIAHTSNSLTVTSGLSLAGAIAEGDGVVGVIPAYGGRVWFVTSAGTVGAVDSGAGAVSDRTLLGYGLVDPLQTAGTVIDRTYYQGTVTGLVRIAPAS